jgi:hypothetical protein
MATDRRRVAGYLPDRVAEKFNAFKAARRVGDSEALAQILVEYFGIEEESVLSLSARVDRLERIIGNVEEF